MAEFFITLSVMPKKNTLDPSGVAVANTLKDLGFDGLRSVVLGKSLHLTLDAVDEADARRQAALMAKNLLAHEAMEEAEILSVVAVSKEKK